ncbi:MAG: acetamidase/formamidase family protein [Balneolaceae bacterium]
MVKTIHSEHSHTYWNHDINPALRIEPNETVEFKIKEASNGQITKDSDVGSVKSLDLDNVNPVTGPVYIDGAEPGDALKVHIEELTCSGWGWTANIPGFGLLADDFPQAALHVWNYNPDSLEPALFGEFGNVPLKPFLGTIGVAPAKNGTHEIIPPRRVGGNMDLRDLSAGTQLILPIECEGALFSAGDSHAAQGDGEVCGTAIESPLNAVLRFELLKGEAPNFPRARTGGPITSHLDKKGYELTTGIGSDLKEGARNAVRGMIELLTAEHKLPPVQAYMLCSVCADLRISEIVNEPNFVVACYFPRMVFG